MAASKTTLVELGRVRKRLAQWRAEHGGRGRPIPETLWAAAAAVASSAGVEATARALDVDRARLSRRVTRSPSGSVVRAPLASSGSFVELDAARVSREGRCWCG